MGEITIRQRHARKHVTQDIVRWCVLNPGRLPKNSGTVVLDLDHIWKPV